MCSITCIHTHTHTHVPVCVFLCKPFVKDNSLQTLTVAEKNKRDFFCENVGSVVVKLCKHFKYFEQKYNRPTINECTWHWVSNECLFNI